MYNPYQFNNPYQNVIPQQHVIQVNGKASVDTIQLAPNSSVLVMDTSAPIVWLCVSDGVGRVTSTPYDITEHQEILTETATDLEQRISNIEITLAKMEDKINAKSNTGRSKSKSIIADDTTD